jgi:hypothetical protein
MFLFLLFLASSLILPFTYSFFFSYNACWLHGLCCSVYPRLRFSVNRLPHRLLNIFYSYLIATCFGLSDGHLQANRTNYSKKLLYLQRVRCVLVQILIIYVSCRQLLSLSLRCIKFKYFKIILLKYVNVKMVAEMIKLI